MRQDNLRHQDVILFMSNEVYVWVPDMKAGLAALDCEKAVARQRHDFAEVGVAQELLEIARNRHIHDAECVVDVVTLPK